MVPIGASDLPVNQEHTRRIVACRMRLPRPARAFLVLISLALIAPARLPVSAATQAPGPKPVGAATMSKQKIPAKSVPEPKISIDADDITAMSVIERSLNGARVRWTITPEARSVAAAFKCSVHVRDATPNDLLQSLRYDDRNECLHVNRRADIYEITLPHGSISFANEPVSQVLKELYFRTLAPEYLYVHPEGVDPIVTGTYDDVPREVVLRALAARLNQYGMTASMQGTVWVARPKGSRPRSANETDKLRVTYLLNHVSLRTAIDLLFRAANVNYVITAPTNGKAHVFKTELKFIFAVYALLDGTKDQSISAVLSTPNLDSPSVITVVHGHTPAGEQ